MRILIAPNAYKGTLSAVSAAFEIRAGLLDGGAEPADLIVHPITDGGDGFVEAMGLLLGGATERIEVPGPGAEKVNAPILWLSVGKCAMACSDVCGLAGIKSPSPLTFGSYGLGELIRAAVVGGATEILVGLGGSATVDLGVPMGSALGVRFFDSQGREAQPRTASDLSSISSCDVSPARKLLDGVRITALCDVNSPLLGPSGGVMTFSPQKGLSGAHLVAHHEVCSRVAQASDRDCLDASGLPGAGAAGGLGAGLAWFAGAELVMGFRFFASQTGLIERLPDVDLVITGEGRFDATSYSGKAVAGLVELCRPLRLPVWLICGAAAGPIPDGCTLSVLEYGSGESPVFAHDAACVLRRTSHRVAAETGLVL
ncbi:MAG: glycerate kinase [Candidatus Brocadiia bacterium]